MWHPSAKDSTYLASRSACRDSLPAPAAVGTTTAARSTPGANAVAAPLVAIAATVTITLGRATAPGAVVAAAIATTFPGRAVKLGAAAVQTVPAGATTAPDAVTTTVATTANAVLVAVAATAGGAGDTGPPFVPGAVRPPAGGIAPATHYGTTVTGCPAAKPGTTGDAAAVPS